MSGDQARRRSKIDEQEVSSSAPAALIVKTFTSVAWSVLYFSRVLINGLVWRCGQTAVSCTFISLSSVRTRHHQTVPLASFTAPVASSHLSAPQQCPAAPHPPAVLLYSVRFAKADRRMPHWRVQESDSPILSLRTDSRLHLLPPC